MKPEVEQNGRHADRWLSLGCLAVPAHVLLVVVATGQRCFRRLGGESMGAAEPPSMHRTATDDSELSGPEGQEFPGPGALRQRLLSGNPDSPAAAGLKVPFCSNNSYPRLRTEVLFVVYRRSLDPSATL